MNRKLTVAIVQPELTPSMSESLERFQGKAKRVLDLRNQPEE